MGSRLTSQPAESPCAVAKRSERPRVAYLDNLYPTMSHTFVRREIRALETLGWSVERFAIRREPILSLEDDEDRAEFARVDAILERSILSLLRATVAQMTASPRRFLRALRTAVSLGLGSDQGILRHLAYLVEASVLQRALAAVGAAHLHAHFASNAAAVALLCRDLGGPPYSFAAHGTACFDSGPRAGLDAKVASAAFVAAASDYARAQLMRWSDPSHWPKLHVVRCGVDETFLEREPTPVDRNVRLVSVARFSPEKGQLLLLEAARELSADGVEFELALVGEGESRDCIRERIELLGLSSCVRLTGALSGEEVRHYLEGSRALVLPSLAEGLPVVLMEAFAAGRPVITTSVGGIPELVEPGVNGWLVAPGSVAALTRAMREALAATPESLTEMGLRGRKRVAALYDVRREAERLAALIATAHRA